MLPLLLEKCEMAILEQKTKQTNKKHNNTKYLETFIKFRVVFVFHAAFMYIQPSVKKMHFTIASTVCCSKFYSYFNRVVFKNNVVCV